MKKHLLGGVAKGAFGEAEADAKVRSLEEQQTIWFGCFEG